jgi:hypothetical protein
MWVVDHVLIEHGVRVAQDKGRLVLVVQSRIAVIHLFTVHSEEHRIDNCLASLIRPNPSMFTLKGLCKHVTHLHRVAKERLKAAEARRPAPPYAWAIHWFYCLTNQQIELFEETLKLLYGLSVFLRVGSPWSTLLLNLSSDTEPDNGDRSRVPLHANVLRLNKKVLVDRRSDSMRVGNRADLDLFKFLDDLVHYTCSTYKVLARSLNLDPFLLKVLNQLLVRTQEQHEHVNQLVNVARLLSIL